MTLDRIYPLHMVIYILCFLSAAVSYWFIVEGVATGHPFRVLAVVEMIAIATPCLLAYFCDGKRFFGFELLDIRHQSWAYVFGDGFLLPGAFIATAVIWRDHAWQMPFWVQSQWWFAAIAVTAIVLAVALNTADKIRYRKYDAVLALDNPGKLFHNWVIVPVMIGALLTTAVPVLFVEWSAWTGVVLSGVLLWGVLVIVDDKLRFVNPHWQYRLWDAQRFVPFPVRFQTAVMTGRALKKLDELERR